MGHEATNGKHGAGRGGGAGVEPPSLRDQLGLTDRELLEMGEIGAMYYRQGVVDKARTIFEGLVEIDPHSAAARSALGAVLTHTERFDEALEHLDRAVELDPRQIAPYVNRAEVYIRQQRFPEAVDDLKRAVELDPTESDPAANRARAMAVGIAEALRAQGVTQG